METYYQNPILSGFHPDPSLCRVDEDYYLVTSSFAYFPGLPVFHSRDLVHWEQIGYGIDREEQIDYSQSAFSEGLWAPTIRWHDGVFYIINTLVQNGRESDRTNFVITARDPSGPWSNPVVIDHADGIDSSLFFEEGGRVWYCGNYISATPKFDGHHGIYLCELDPITMQFKGSRKIILDGNKIHGKWTEAPHIFKKDGYYYLMIAEGGTFTNHSVMLFRSETVDGEYEICPHNPIVTHRHLPLSYPIAATGHADFVQTQRGEWWMVLLAVRPYGGFQYNLGRETFLAPIAWDEEGWPLLDTPDGLVPSRCRRPDLPNVPSRWQSTVDHFENEQLSLCWNTIRCPKRSFYSLQERKGFLRLHLGAERLWDERITPRFLGRRQEHMYFAACVKMEFTPNEGEEAGLALVQSDEFHYVFTVTKVGGEVVLQLYQHENVGIATNYDFTTRVIQKTVLATKVLANNDGNIYLYALSDKEKYRFAYGFREGEQRSLLDNVDASLLSTTRAGGFVGVYIGLYASSNGAESTNVADFDWFEYAPLEP